MRVKIIVDSTVDMDPVLKQKVKAVPIMVRFGQQDYLDGVDIDAAKFYELLAQSEELPTSSQPTPAAFEDAFREAVEAGYEVVCITIAAQLSGTYQSACIGAGEFPGQVFVVDSRTACIGAGVLAAYAQELAEQGLGGRAIQEKLEQVRERVRLYFMVDTLEYLKKGGRLNSTVAMVGGLLNIKPVLTVVGLGEVKMLTTARGMKKAFAALNQEMEKHGGIDWEMPRQLGYTGASDENLRKYQEENRDLWAPETPVSTVGSAIGVHVGPGAVGIAFFSQE